MARRARSFFLVWLIAIVGILVATPIPTTRESVHRIRLPLDPSLRVPLQSFFLVVEQQQIVRGGQVDSIDVGDRGYQAPVHDRESLYERIGALPVGSTVELRGRGHDGDWSAVLPVVESSPLSEFARQWPLLLAGAFHVLVGALVLVGGRHPVVAPVAAVCLCLGVGMLSTTDQILPVGNDLMTRLDVRARLGLLAWSLVPPSLLHLAMRFPVVSERFQSGGLVGATYALWGFVVVAGQLRFDDATTLNVVDQLVLAVAIVAAVVLVFTSLWRREELSPIEYSRARSLALGLCLGWLGPVIAAGHALNPSPTVSRVLSLGTLALPIALAYSIVRYQLIDPALWGIRHLRSWGASLAGLLLGGGALWIVHRTSVGSDEAPPSGLFILLVGGVALYEVFRRMIGVALGRWVPTPLDPHVVVSEAIPRLVDSRSAAEAVEVLKNVARAHLDTESLEIGTLGSNEGVENRELWRNATAAWREREGLRATTLGQPGRESDPGPDRPELLLPIRSSRGPVQLIAASSRNDGLPYTPRDTEVFERIGELAALALPASARAYELEGLVRARTESLVEALRDRESVLMAAERLLEADSLDDVLACVAAFGQRVGVEIVPLPAELASLSFCGEGRRQLVLDRGLLLQCRGDEARLEAIQSEQATVVAFARLSLGRIANVAGLRAEVRRKSAEVGRMTARAYQAEFVRNLAHELRKPVEEAQSLASVLREDVADSCKPQVLRVLSICADLLRRLDNLLGQTGVRLNLQKFDLTQIVGAAVDRASVLEPRREYVVENELAPLPVVADPTRLRAVVENLLDNAIRATRPAAVVTVRSGMCFERGQECSEALVYIEVEDDGAGVASGLAETIFEAGVSAFPGGFGLGLSLCAATAKAHGGEISFVGNSPGARFRLVIPQLPRLGSEEGLW